MKQIIISLLILSAIPVQAIDIQTYYIDAKQKDANGLDVSMTLMFTGEASDTAFIFNFNSSAKIKTMSLLSSSKNIQHTFNQTEDDRMVILLSDKIEQRSDLTLYLDYFVFTKHLDNGELVFKGEQAWYPYNRGDIFDYKLKYQSYVDKYTIAIQDTLVTSNVIPLIFLPQDIFNKSYCMCGETDIFGFFQTDALELSDEIVLKICNSLNYYASLFGDYDHEYLSLIELSSFAAAQSLPAIILFGTNHVEYYTYPGWSDWPSHEIAHQWIGRSLYIDDSPNLKGRGFLEESLTEYLNLCFIEYSYGKDSLDGYLQYDSLLYNKIVNTDSDKPLLEVYSSVSKEDAILAYRKGPLILHKFRNSIGNDKWFAMMKEFYKRFKNNVVNYDLFIHFLYEYQIKVEHIMQLEKNLTRVGYPD